MSTAHATDTARPISIERLREAVSGRVIGPDDADYDEARKVTSGRDRPPPGGHRPRRRRRRRPGGRQPRPRNRAGAGGPERRPQRRRPQRDGGRDRPRPRATCRRSTSTSRAGRPGPQTGLTAGAYTTAAGEHGLVTGFGDTGSVGIGGITTGGGIGYLVRKFGMTIDDVLAAEIVTADGALHQVDADHEPDLFWAIRGGGGNFGVVTRFKYRLHELPSVVGGMLILPATPDVVAGFIAASEAAPDELTTIANVMPCPPMPFVPEEHHGELVVFGAHHLRRRRRRTASERSRRCGRWRRRWPTWSIRCRTPRSTRRRTRSTTRRRPR